MTFEDAKTGIVIDGDFPCGSAGPIRELNAGVYEVDYQREELPQWFQDLLDELFGGAGVPKEYMAHVRVRNTGETTRSVTLRFLLSAKGANYMYPPWWVRDEDGWSWIPPENTAHDHENLYIDTTVEVDPGESIRIASAPYEEPEIVCEKARRLAERSDIWTYREIGATAQGRPIPLLETEPRPLKLVVEATMQSCEPASWGIMHVAHWLTIPTTRAGCLLNQIQFCLLPMTNPDGVFEGRSVTNSVGEVPKFGINDLVAGTRAAPRETEAVWNYLLQLKPDAQIEVHAHFTQQGFTRSIGMQDRDSMPERLQAKAAVIEDAIHANFHADPLDNRKVLIDPRKPEHNVYGDRHVNEMAGVIRTFLQAVPDSVESHSADVREMTETIAGALIRWQSDQR